MTTADSLAARPPEVGLIGLGLMGAVLARRLIEAGIHVVGFDIDPEKTARLGAIGGRSASSAGDVARQCAVIVLALFDTDQVEQVVKEALLPAVGTNSGKI